MDRYRIYRIDDDGTARLVVLPSAASAEEALLDGYDRERSRRGDAALIREGETYFVVADDGRNPAGRQALFTLGRPVVDPPVQVMATKLGR